MERNQRDLPMPLELSFPQLNGGVEQGLNDAGIETFEGEYPRHIVRECTQNALDARAGSSALVRVELQIRNISAAEIPGLGDLRRSLESASTYWKTNEKTVRFCKRALLWTRGSEVIVLEVSDFGTQGLNGSDDDRDGSWFGLVRSGGVSINQDDAGGAFGIGKSAPFAGSHARTVFYSTRNQAGERAFQGVSKLVTHLDSNGHKTQATGFVGTHDHDNGGCRSVRIAEEIPPLFRRDEIGTSLFIVAYRHLGSDAWTKPFVREAVENFWPAIFRGSLAFQIGDERIDATTLPLLMARFAVEGDFTSRYFYRAVSGANHREWAKSIPHLGSCRLFLVPGDATYPKRVYMTRQTGMVIYEATRFRSYRPFAGLFICDSHEGNAYLRKLEPPRHDKWDPNRADDVPQAKRVLRSVREWINECLRDLNPDENVSEADVPELNRYLPDDEDEPLADDSTSDFEKQGEEGIVSRPRKGKLLISEVIVRRPGGQRQGREAIPEDGNEEGDGVGDGRPNPNGEPNETSGGKSETAGGGATGETRQREIKTLLNIRAIRSGVDTYELFVRADQGCSGCLRIVSVGEDNREDSDLRISKLVEVESGTDIASEQFSIREGQLIRMRATIQSAVVLSLRAYCHGN